MNSIAVVFSVVLGFAGLCGLYRLRKATLGTTLQAAWCWACGAWVGLSVVVSCYPHNDSVVGSHFHYAAAVASFYPLMAILGAKRPQNVAWQWIVATLAVILILPSLEQWLFWSSSRFRLEGARSWFLLVLIGLGWSIYLPTRFWPSSLLVSAAQGLLLWEQLPWSPPPLPFPSPCVALGLFSAALALVVLGWPKAAAVEYRNDQLWRDFRNQFGLLWALRVAERFNAAAESYGWQVRLSWSGFQSLDHRPLTSISPELAAQTNAVLDNLLLKFVSPEWIAKRRTAP